MIQSVEAQERYRKSIGGRTDFSKPVSQLVEEIRNELSATRSKLTDLRYGTCYREQVEPLDGLITCGLITLFMVRSDMIKREIAKLDQERGPHLQFNSRGLSRDWCHCFVCAAPTAERTLMPDIAAFVASKAEGEEIVRWFGHGAWLDYRGHEPNWIQVKVGACQRHLPALKQLEALVSYYGVIRQRDIEEARAVPPVPEQVPPAETAANVVGTQPQDLGDGTTCSPQ